MYFKSLKTVITVVSLCLISSICHAQSSIISAGFNHTLVICEHKDVWAVGLNGNGQLGDSTTTDRIIPVKVKGLSNIIAVAGGGQHSLALRSDSTVWAWGNNGSGQLGDSTYTDRHVPVRIWTLKSIIAIATGDGFSIALDKNGKVWTWGINTYGSLGDGGYTTRNYPTTVSLLSSYKMIAIGAGYNHGVAIRNDSVPYGWGLNSNGQLGQGTNSLHDKPEQIKSAFKTIMFDGGWQHSIMIKYDSTVWGMGAGSRGQLGNSTGNQIKYPIKVSNITKIAAAGAGTAWDHSIALGANGLVYTWGYNGYGELGDSTTTIEYAPIQVKNLDHIIAVNAGQYFSVAIRQDGTVWTWGANGNGQLGDSSTTERHLPVQMKLNCLAAHKCTVLPGFSSSATGICPGSTVSFANKSTGHGTLTHQWKINGKLFSSARDTSYYFANTGKYVITLVSSDSNCSDSSGTTISVIGPMDSLSLPYASNACSSVPLSIKAVAAKLGKYDVKLNDSGKAYITTPYDTLQTPLRHFSIETWFRLDNMKSLPQFMVSKGVSDYTAGHWSLYVDRDSTASFHIYKGSYLVAKGTTHFKPGVWYHVCGTWDGDTMRIYINGKFEGKTALSAPITEYRQGLNFGRLSSVYYSFYGEIEEVRLWDSARTAAQVKANYKTILPSNTKGILGYWRLDEGTGTTSSDDSYIHNDATLNGYPKWIKSTAPLYPYLKWNPSTNLSDSLGDSVVATITSNTKYTVTATNFITGCSNSDSVSLTVKTPPVVNAGADASVCLKDSVQIGSVSTSGNSYSWISIPSGFSSSVSNPKVSPAVNTTYILTQSNSAAGCSKSDSVKINVNPLPAVGIIKGAYVCSGSGINTGASAVSNNIYSWTSRPAGFTSTLANPTAYPVVNTTYTLVEKDTLTGCSNLDSVSINVNPLPITTIDISGNDTICSGDSVQLAGQRNYGNALDFDGTNDSVLTGGNSSLNLFPITVSFWVKTSQSAADVGLVNKYVSGTINGYQVYTYSGHVYAWYMKSKGNYVFAGSGKGLDGGAIDDGKWHYVAFTVDSSGGKLYVDGNMNASRSWTGSVGACTTTQPMQFGNYPGSIVKKGTFQGQLDEVRIWKKALTSKELQAVANTAIPGNSSNLAAYWPLDEGKGKQAHDYTGNGNEGTLLNFALTGTSSNWVKASNGVKIANYSWTASNGKKITSDTFYVKPTAAITYYHSGTLISSGCTKTDSISIVVDPSPVAYAGISDTICPGDSTQLGGKAVSGNKYSWKSKPSGFVSSLNNPIVHPKATTTYYLTETNTAGCSKTDSVKITIDSPAKAGANVSICNGSGASLGGKSLPGYSYSWTSNPSGFTSSTYGITVTPSGATTYYLSQKSALGCNSIDSAIVTVNPLPVVAAGTSQTICSGGSVKLGASSVSGHTYSWISKPSGFTSSSSNPSVSPVKTTTYYLTETITATGCKALDSVTVTVNPIPKANVVSAKSICEGDSLALGATAVSGNTYSWTSNPSGYTSSSSNPTAKPTVTTTYILTETITATGCTKSDSVKITVNPLPAASAGTATAICTGSSASIGASSTSGHTYSWSSNPTGFSSTKSNPGVSPLVTTVYILKETITATGCNKTDSVKITVNPVPSAFVGSATSICAGDSVSLGASAVSGNTYSWVSKPSGFTSSASNPVVHPVSTMKYYLTETITATSCSKTDSVIITVNPLPLTSINGKDTACLNSQVQYNAANHKGNSYAWSLAGGIVMFSKADTLFSRWTTAGTDSIMVTETDKNGCVNTATMKVTVLKLPATSISGPDSVCMGVESQYLAAAHTGSSYIWNITGGKKVSSNMDTLVANWTNAGTNRMTLKETDGFGCSITYVIYVRTFENPKADFSWSGNCAGSPVKFYNKSKTYDKQDWKFGDGNTSALDSPSHIYSTNGVYKALLHLQTDKGCSDTISKAVQINPIPNPHWSMSGSKTSYDFIADDSTYKVSDYSWQFGDGKSGNGRKVNHMYARDSVYKVKLAVLNSFGCSNSFDSTFSTTTAVEEYADGSIKFLVYPNPFSEQATLQYELAKPSKVKIAVFTMQGQKIMTLADANQSPGMYRFILHPTENMPAGVYIMQVIIDNTVLKKQIIKLR